MKPTSSINFNGQDNTPAVIFRPTLFGTGLMLQGAILNMMITDSQAKMTITRIQQQMHKMFQADGMSAFTSEFAPMFCLQYVAGQLQPLELQKLAEATAHVTFPEFFGEDLAQAEATYEIYLDQIKANAGLAGTKTPRTPKKAEKAPENASEGTPPAAPAAEAPAAEPTAIESLGDVAAGVLHNASMSPGAAGVLEALAELDKHDMPGTEAEQPEGEPVPDTVVVAPKYDEKDVAHADLHNALADAAKEAGKKPRTATEAINAAVSAPEAPKKAAGKKAAADKKPEAPKTTKNVSPREVLFGKKAPAEVRIDKENPKKAAVQAKSAEPKKTAARNK